MDQAQQYLTHESPVWHEKSDFIIHAKVDSDDNILRLEQLWARRVDGEDDHGILVYETGNQSE